MFQPLIKKIVAVLHPTVKRVGTVYFDEEIKHSNEDFFEVNIHRFFSNTGRDVVTGLTLQEIKLLDEQKAGAVRFSGDPFWICRVTAENKSTRAVFEDVQAFMFKNKLEGLSVSEVCTGYFAEGPTFLKYLVHNRLDLLLYKPLDKALVYNTIPKIVRCILHLGPNTDCENEMKFLLKDHPLSPKNKFQLNGKPLYLVFKKK